MSRTVSLTFIAATIAANIRLTSSMINKNKFLIVEGKTDKLFFERICDNDIYVNFVNCLINNAAILRANGGVPVKTNPKKALIEFCRNADITNTNICNAINGLDVLCIVDRDENKFSDFTYSKLLLTDKRDLESTAIACESYSFKDYSNLITDTEIAKAQFLSFQLSNIRSAFALYKRDHNDLETIDQCLRDADLFNGNYGYIKDDSLELRHFISFLERIPGNGISRLPGAGEIVRPVIYNYITSSEIFGPDYNNVTVSNFPLNWADDKWDYIRGHDLLLFIEKYDPQIWSTYPRGIPCRDAKISDEVMNNVDVGKFKNTDIYQKLVQYNYIS